MGDLDARLALDRAFESCALFDRSDLGRLLGTGPDLLDLLHRLSTGAVRELTPGEGKPTVLTTPKGRIIDLLFVHRPDRRRVLLVGAAGCAARVAAHLDRYTFSEQTGLRDVSGETSQLAVVGPASAEVLRSCGVEPPAPHGVTCSSVGGTTVEVLGQDGFDATGYSLVSPLADSGRVRAILEEAVQQAGGCAAGGNVLEAYRILRGVPAAGHELTGDYNPLEAGLRSAVSFAKGCYVGQEVVARLNTYDKISRSLAGLELQVGGVLPPVGAVLFHEGLAVGALTSAAIPPGSERAVGLGYVKRKALKPGLELRIGEDGPVARVVELPFRRFRGE